MSEDERKQIPTDERESVTTGGDDVEGHVLIEGTSERENVPVDDDSERRNLPDGNS